MRPPLGKPVPLSGIQVDVTTRLGALTPATPTGLPTLDRMLGGGLRAGSFVSITGTAGVGKTALSLSFAYMAARARAAAVFTGPALDETELVARLAARALHRRHPEAVTPYGSIWSGDAFTGEVSRRQVAEAVEVVMRKVGGLFHVQRLDPRAGVEQIAEGAMELWKRHERLVVVVDGVEGVGARGEQASGVLAAGLELAGLAEQGAAVVVTTQFRWAEPLATVSTASLELAPVKASGSPLMEKQRALGARWVDLTVTRHRLGPVGVVPLRFVAGAATFEERAP